MDLLQKPPPPAVDRRATSKRSRQPRRGSHGNASVDPCGSFVKRPFRIARDRFIFLGIQTYGTKQGKKREKQRVKEQKAKNIKSANWL